jgi:hypothetical protein
MHKLLGCALVAAALWEQNALARTADPFAGTFENKETRLALAHQSGNYSGAILSDGQTLPVQAKSLNGALQGTFTSQEQSASFGARRNGNRLGLTTDGRTHILEIAAAMASLLVGDWQTPRGPGRINANGTAVIGDKTHRWLDEAGTIVFRGAGQPLLVGCELTGDLGTGKVPAVQMPLHRLRPARSPAAAEAALTTR